jgi:hypothetical protein
MNKRIQIVVRNIGLEGTDRAMWTLELEFKEEPAFELAMTTLAAGLINPLEQSVILTNELGQVLGFNPHHYAYHFVDNAEDWPPTKWSELPPDGASPPTRERL